MVAILQIRRAVVAAGAALVLAGVLAACGASSTPVAAPTTGGVSPSAAASGAVGSASAAATTSPSAAAVGPSFAPDACATLVTKDEIETSIGGTVGRLELNGKSDAVVGIPPYGGSLCWYPITDGVFVQLTVGHAPDAASLAGALATYKTRNPGTEVSGLGDTAYSSDNGLMVVDGARFVCVTIFSSTLESAASDAAQVDLAKKVLARW